MAWKYFGLRFRQVVWLEKRIISHFFLSLFRISIFDLYFTGLQRDRSQFV